MTGALARRDVAIAFVAAAVAYVAYLGLATEGTWRIDAPTRFGRVFSAVALNLLHGRFDVDPELLLYEAYVRDGLAYPYFGIFAALARLPLIPFADLTVVHVGRPLAALAAALAAMFQALAMLHATAGARSPALRGILAALPLVAGPQVYLLARPNMYEEAALWGLCWASAVVAAGVCLALRDGRAPVRLYIALAAAAGLAVTARVTAGLGACAFAALVGAARLWWEARAAGKEPLRRLLGREAASATLAGAVPIAVQLAVNFARWRNPFEFADLARMAVVHESDPTRLPRLMAQGAFNLERLWFGLQYYFAPAWAFPTAAGAPRFEAWMRVWLDAAELPPSTPLLTDGLLMALAAVGAWAICRRGVPRPAIWAAGGAGLATGAAVLMSAIYMALRYRVDIQPLLLWLGLAGAHRLTRAAPRLWLTATAAAILAISVLGSLAMYAAYLDINLGPAFPVHDPLREIYWSVRRHLIP